ncbi:MAG: Hsp20/alpha crystallin family protein [Chloroflexi bacterium]|nr:Hsp20/alpha crystallin family protein [Chloroflexota bacterium]
MNDLERLQTLAPLVVVVSDARAVFSTREDSAPRWLFTRQPPGWCPPTDLYETEDKLVVQVEIAGMRHSDFNVVLNDRRLTISGVRRDSGERRAYYQMEVHFGEFRVDLELPTPVSLQGIEAGYHDGFLRMLFPKLNGLRDTAP